MVSSDNSTKERDTLKKTLSDDKLVEELKDRNKLIPEREIFSWRAPARPFKRRDREFWITVLAMVVIGGLIIFVVEGYMPVILIIAVVFLFYILNTVEPEELQYTVTNKGIKIGDKKNRWADMGGRFWFTNKFENKVLIIETYDFPYRLEIMVLNNEIEKLRKTLKQYLIEEEIPASKLDKASDWFSNKLPGNKQSPGQ